MGVVDNVFIVVRIAKRFMKGFCHSYFFVSKIVFYYYKLCKQPVLLC